MNSQNGWPLVTIGELDRSPIPGTSIVPIPGVLRGDVATVLHWVGVQFNARVESLYNPGCWGWNSPTPIPGTSIYSNHSSGTAIDFNAPSFPWKLYTMTSAQRQVCRDIAAETEGVVVWGGDFPTFVDEMHFEIDATAEEVARIANKLIEEEEMPTESDAINFIRADRGDVTYNPSQEEINGAMKTSYKDWAYNLLALNNGDTVNILNALKWDNTPDNKYKVQSQSKKYWLYQFMSNVNKKYKLLDKPVYVEE